MTSKADRIDLRHAPMAFTEQGVAMLSSVLNNGRAIRVTSKIVRAFVRLRRMVSSNAELARRLNDLEKKYDAQFKVVFDAIRKLMRPPEKPQRCRAPRIHDSCCLCWLSLSPRWVPRPGGRSAISNAEAGLPAASCQLPWVRRPAGRGRLR